MAKILIVTSRFLPNSAGGAEKLAFDYADILSQNHDITIATTTAKDYISWKNELNSGESFYKNIKIIRFKVLRERNIKKMNSVLDSCLNNLNNIKPHLEEKFIIEQGPYCPDLIDYIESNQKEFNLIFLVGYLYYPIVFSIPLLKIPFIVVPTFHDEPVLNLPIFKRTYLPNYFYCFNAPEELDIYRNKFSNRITNYSMIGTYIPLPDISHVHSQIHSNNNRIDIDESFKILTIGRIEPAKGYPRLLSEFTEWKEISKSNEIKLICLGSASNVDIKKYQHILFPGFVSEEDKSNFLIQSNLLINPSPFESFSIAIMEAWSYEKPVLVNAISEVMVGHINRCQGGLYYSDNISFFLMLNHLIQNDSLRERLGKNGRLYVE
ncbi:MAG: glycosyltransferase family 4 protein, partial [Leptospira sp.]|nr:glycosyltransferase family 4 protein [Leptospira sp.]